MSSSESISNRVISELTSDGRCWRLDWLGTLDTPTSHNPHKLTISAAFSPLEKEVSDPANISFEEVLGARVEEQRIVRLGLGDLPMLKHFGVWRDGIQLPEPDIPAYHLDEVGFGTGEVDCVLTGNFKFDSRQLSKVDVVPDEIDPVILDDGGLLQKHAETRFSWCLVTRPPTADLPRLIIPAWELIRTYYGYRTPMAHRLFYADEKAALDELLYVDQCGLASDGRHHVHFKSNEALDSDGPLVASIALVPRAKAGWRRPWETYVLMSHRSKWVAPFSFPPATKAKPFGFRGIYVSTPWGMSVLVTQILTKNFPELGRLVAIAPEIANSSGTRTTEKTPGRQNGDRSDGAGHAVSRRSTTSIADHRITPFDGLAPFSANASGAITMGPSLFEEVVRKTAPGGHAREVVGGSSISDVENSSAGGMPTDVSSAPPAGADTGVRPLNVEDTAGGHHPGDDPVGGRPLCPKDLLAFLKGIKRLDGAGRCEVVALTDESEESEFGPVGVFPDPVGGKGKAWVRRSADSQKNRRIAMARFEFENGLWMLFEIERRQDRGNEDYAICGLARQDGQRLSEGDVQYLLTTCIENKGRWLKDDQRDSYIEVRIRHDTRSEERLMAAIPARLKRALCGDVGASE